MKVGIHIHTTYTHVYVVVDTEIVNDFKRWFLAVQHYAIFIQVKNIHEYFFCYRLFRSPHNIQLFFYFGVQVESNIRRNEYQRFAHINSIQT